MARPDDVERVPDDVERVLKPICDAVGTDFQQLLNRLPVCGSQLLVLFVRRDPTRCAAPQLLRRGLGP